MPYLRTNVFGLVHKSHCYGYQNEAVTIISKRGNVLIVEGSNGDRFPVLETELVDELAEKKPQQAIQIQPIIQPKVVMPIVAKQKPIKHNPTLF